MNKRRAQYAAAVLSVGALALSACSSGGGGGPSGSGPSSGGSTTAVQAQAQEITLGTADDSKGPAVAVAGGKKGGTVHDLEANGINHLDPAQAYVNQEQVIGQLFSRQLTNYKIDPATGKTILVGDLATDAGTSSDGGKTWTYHLKDGLKWEDGTPITAQQVKYGIERLYSSFETAGPQYLQVWLSGQNFRKVYTGPQSGKELPDSVLATPDAKTVVFHFLKPHADAPYAMALSGSGPILKAKDTGPKYDTAPFSNGPYKIASYQPNKALELVRNPNWDASTDPIRNAYPDKWDIQLAIDADSLTQRLQASNGADKTSLALVSSASPTQTSVIATNASYKPRLVNEIQPFVDVFNFNLTRVKDVRVRKAVEYAFPLQQVQTALGGPTQGDLGTNLIGPTVGGFKPTDPFGKPAKPMGDPEKAKELLKEAGVTNLKLTYAFANVQRWQNVYTTLKNAFAKAGITLEGKPIDKTQYYTLVGKVDNPYDMYRTGWGADWPNASTVIPPTQDGRLIADDDPNYSHLNDQHVNSEIDRIGTIGDLAQQTAEWQKLAEYIETNDVPSVPYMYDKYFNVYGTGLGGVSYNSPLGTLSPNTVFVK